MIPPPPPPPDSDRRAFICYEMIISNFADAEACHRRSIANGVPDCIVMILDMRDKFAREVSKLVNRVVGLPPLDEEKMWRRSLRDGVRKLRFVAFERRSAMRLLPRLAKEATHPLGEHRMCVVALSENGTYTTYFDVEPIVEVSKQRARSAKRAKRKRKKKKKKLP